MKISDQKPVGLSGRYVNALYELCIKRNVLNPVISDFIGLKEIIFNNSDIRFLIFSPTIGKIKQSEIIVKVLKKAKANKTTINFCGLLAKNGRLFLLEKLVEDFLKEVSRRRGEINVEVYSVSQLVAKERDKIKNLLSKKTGVNKINIFNILDKALLGGLVIKIGSKMIDTSIKTKLNNLEITLKGEN